MTSSLYWYDYETFGLNPSRDHISQFAGIRTNEKLEIVSEPLVMYCHPPSHRLPSPESCTSLLNPGYPRERVYRQDI